ncbi:MAG: hypothetical protein QXT88_00995 [Desulfurococcaceae archaeon]|uniref:Uncharacterized protein n=1 Tax=Staphylothermus marinus TaxID=2280 RepID=A0A7C4JMN2_STAMA
MRKRSVKPESRVLALTYLNGMYYAMVFRKNFLEEFQVIDESEIIDIGDILDQLNTRDEISYYILCGENKYSFIVPGLNILEGSEYLIQKYNYCRNLVMVAECFDKIRISGFTNTCSGFELW